MSDGDKKIDSRLLEDNFNPFYPICEANRDPRDQIHEYRAFNDYLKFLKIIGIRLIIDSIRYEKTGPGAPLRWPTAYEMQLDLESFIIFSHILLNKVGILMDKLLSCRNPNEWSYDFGKHRNAYLKNRQMSPQYSEILDKMHWYDQNFDWLRNKIIKHGRSLAGSMRNFSVYRRINESLGMLSNEDQELVQNLINKYGQQNNRFLSIQPNPNIMLDEFLSLIMEYNIELTQDDLNDLGRMVQRNGAVIDVTVLSEQIRKFLEEIASLFPLTN